MTGINERDVEIEHLKTTVIALDEKVKVRILRFLISQVMDDMKSDVDNSRRDLAESEGKRGELQQHITETGVKVGDDAKEHKSYQDQLIAENEDLR